MLVSHIIGKLQRLIPNDRTIKFYEQFYIDVSWILHEQSLTVIRTELNNVDKKWILGGLFNYILLKN